MKSLIILIISISSVGAFAQELDRNKINESLKTIKAIPLTHDGRDGVWFAKESADILLNLVQNKFKLSLDIIDMQNKQINTLQRANKLRKESAEEYEKMANFNIKMFNMVMEYLPDLSSSPSWYETSTAFYLYGVVTGVVTIVLASWVLDNIQRIP